MEIEEYMYIDTKGSQFGVLGIFQSNLIDCDVM